MHFGWLFVRAFVSGAILGLHPTCSSSRPLREVSTWTKALRSQKFEEEMLQPVSGGTSRVRTIITGTTTTPLLFLQPRHGWGGGERRVGKGGSHILAAPLSVPGWQRLEPPEQCWVCWPLTHSYPGLTSRTIRHEQGHPEHQQHNERRGCSTHASFSEEIFSPSSPSVLFFSPQSCDQSLQTYGSMARQGFPQAPGLILPLQTSASWAVIHMAGILWAVSTEGCSTTLQSRTTALGKLFSRSS